MSNRTLRDSAKAALPVPIRRVLRGALHYVQRVGRWPVILWQVRGEGPADEVRLLLSALAAPVYALEAPLEWQDPVLLFDTAVNVPGVGRFHLRKRCDDLWHVLPWRERSIVAHLRRQLRPGDTFVDAGANIGVYAVLAGRLVGPAGRVFAIEMMPDTAQQLEENVGLNGLENVEIVRLALSDAGGQVVTASVEPGKYGQASINSRNKERAHRTRVSVQTTTLDDVAADVQSVRLMKIDLEGAELLALKGGLAALSKTEGVIYESWGRARSAQDPVDACLSNAGFELESLDGNNRLATRLRRPGQGYA